MPFDVREALEIVLSDPATRQACGHMLAFEVGSQLQRHSAAWDAERSSVASSLTSEMERLLLGGAAPQRVQEATARHENVMATFTRDVADRHAAVARACRRTFLQWLRAASEDRGSLLSAPGAAVGAISMCLPVEYGRESALGFGCGGGGGAGGSQPSSAPPPALRIPSSATPGESERGRDAVTVVLAPLASLPACLPLVNGSDRIPDRESTQRALVMLSRIANRHRPLRATNAVLLFCGSRDEMRSTCIDPIGDFVFELVDDDEGDGDGDGGNSDGAPVAVSAALAELVAADRASVEPLRGLWGATIAVCVRRACSTTIREVLSNCVTLWNCASLVVAVSNSFSAAETSLWVEQCCGELRLLALETATSLRSAQTHVAAAATPAAALSSPLPLGAPVRVFVPATKLPAVTQALRSRLRAA
jgi:hypothetical protein